MRKEADRVGAAGRPTGQGWSQLVELGVALVGSALIGLERQTRRSNVGLRTHTIIGFSAALVHAGLEVRFHRSARRARGARPFPVAAQIVAGIGLPAVG